jgi:hypothetical protein
MFKTTKSSECVSSKEVAKSFSLQWVIFSLCSMILYVFFPCDTVLCERARWKLIHFILESNISITRSDSCVLSIRRHPQWLVLCIPLLQILPCFRKEFLYNSPYNNDVIFIFNSSFPLEFAIERSYLFPAVELYIGYITRMRNIWIKFYIGAHSST